MSEDKTKRMKACEIAGMEIFHQLESQGIKMVGCVVGWADDGTEFVVKMMIHSNEEDKGYDLPVANKGFQIDYEYIDYPQFA